MFCDRNFRVFCRETWYPEIGEKVLAHFKTKTGKSKQRDDAVVVSLDYAAGKIVVGFIQDEINTRFKRNFVDSEVIYDRKSYTVC